MFKFGQILVSTLVLAASAVGLSACGQQGPLYLPKEPSAANRATLPETLMPFKLKKATPSAPAETNRAESPNTSETQ
jgi:predicted small lipoprotein YifL